MLVICVVNCVLLVCFASADLNFILFQINASTFDQKRALVSLSKASRSEFISTNKLTSLPDLVLVPHEIVNETEKYLSSRGMTYKFLPPRSVLPASIFTKESEYFSYNDFFDSEKVHSSIEKMVQKSKVEGSPVRAEIFNYGLTYQNRSMMATRLNHKSSGQNKNPVILIDATIHGNEWIGPPAAHNIIEQLLFNKTGHELLLKFDVVVAPVVNRDGYDDSLNSINPYIHGRKNRRASARKKCFLRMNEGTDINRNFDWFWNSTALTENPCSEGYRGDYPFSEPETKALAELMQTPKVLFYYTIHSFGNKIMYPFGNTDKKVENFENMRKVALTGKEAIERTFTVDPPYEVGSTLEILTRTSGASKDFAAGKLKIRYSLIHEVGGQKPDNQPNVEDIKTYVNIVWTGFTAMAGKILELENL